MLALANPAHARFRMGKFLHKTVCLAVGIGTAPVLLPATEIAKQVEMYRLLRKEQYKAACIVNGQVYDWYWLDQWW